MRFDGCGIEGIGSDFIVTGRIAKVVQLPSEGPGRLAAILWSVNRTDGGALGFAKQSTSSAPQAFQGRLNSRL